MSIFSQLPFELIREILLFDSRFVFRKKTLLYIDKIPKDDVRFLLYANVPRIYERSVNNWSVILGTNTRFVMSHRLRPDLIWEYSFVTFHNDPHMNMISHIATSAIYQPLYW